VTRRIAEFDEADHAHRFARWMGDEYTVCAGMTLMYAVRPKSQREKDFPGYDVDADHYDDEEN
jgi:hypothetical protein